MSCEKTTNASAQRGERDAPWCIDDDGVLAFLTLCTWPWWRSEWQEGEKYVEPRMTLRL